MDRITKKNRDDWNRFSAEYMKNTQSEERLHEILADPACAFVPEVWDAICQRFHSLSGRMICVPSCGDCHAVYAFALLGASVTACDISENQISAAQQSAQRLGIHNSIRFVCADTMSLENVPDNSFDLVYTSRGVFVWLNDLPSMFRQVVRVLKEGGWYIGCDIHPFQRPFDESMAPMKPYDAVGPIENEWNVNFHWRMSDLLNSVISSRLALKQVVEITEKGNSILPKWLCLCAQKDE